jgi:hypothetical protein
MIREPVVADRFYPGSHESLVKELKSLIVETTKKEDVLGALSPHAGYIYSGKIAGAVFSSINIPDNVIIISPNHTGLGERGAIMVSGEWNMPLGNVKINSQLAETILNRAKILNNDYRAHLREHSLEVQLPFIQYLKSNFQMVPITLMNLSYEECEELGKDLASAIKDYPSKILIIASSDMTHYESKKSAEEKDKKAIDEMLNLNPEGLYETVHRYNISMCGYIPATVMLITCKEMGAKKGKLIKYGTSGDVSGDYYQVVGYAGVVIK